MVKRWLILCCLILACLSACTPSRAIENQDIGDMLDKIVQYDDVKRVEAKSLGPGVDIYIYLKKGYMEQSVDDIMQLIMDSMTLEVIEALEKEIGYRSVPETSVFFRLNRSTQYRYDAILTEESPEQYTWTQISIEQ